LIFCGGIAKAVKKAVAYKDKNKLQVDIILEARAHKEFAEILQLNTYMRRILLDNFTIEEPLKAADIIGALCETESSGNITEKTILQ
jgi:nicotinate-nucleotide pyrophosphorylase (carboxylating)